MSYTHWRTLSTLRLVSWSSVKSVQKYQQQIVSETFIFRLCGRNVLRVTCLALLQMRLTCFEAYNQLKTKSSSCNTLPPRSQPDSDDGRAML